VSNINANIKEVATYLVIILVAIIIALHMNVVVSGSMEPVMYRGDIVIIGDPTNIQVGDIVVYHATWFDQPVIHRVIATGKDSNGNMFYTIKGDNNPVPDPDPVYPNQIVSKVVNYPWSSGPGQAPVIIPKIGYITIWIRGL
jgi:signal peptidase